MHMLYVIRVPDYDYAYEYSRWQTIRADYI